MGNYRSNVNFVSVPLKGCDAILGMNWLQQFNPKIDWNERTMRLQQQNQSILIPGLPANQAASSLPTATAAAETAAASVISLGSTIPVLPSSSNSTPRPLQTLSTRGIRRLLRRNEIECAVFASVQPLESSPSGSPSDPLVSSLLSDFLTCFLLNCPPNFPHLARSITALNSLNPLPLLPAPSTA